MMLIDSLPNDVMVKISEYTNNVLYKNGRFILIQKIPKNDYRYETLSIINKYMYFAPDRNIVTHGTHLYLYIYLKHINFKENGFTFMLYYIYDFMDKIFTFRMTKCFISNIRGSMSILDTTEYIQRFS